MNTGQYKCAHARCGGLFTARTADRARGWARFCSKSCKASAQEARTGQHFANLYPDLVELIALMYPFMSTKDLADFLGLPWRRLRKYAAKRRLLKDQHWLREQGRPAHWPSEPELREVYRLRVALTRAINLALNQQGMEPTT